jgi:phosphomannomutase
MSNEHVASLFAFLNSAKVKEKYEFYRRGGGAVTGTYLPKSKIGYKLTDSEKQQIIEQYQKQIPIQVIANKIGRSNDSIRNVLKRAGIYDVDRDKLSNLIAGHESIKTTYTNKKR